MSGALQAPGVRIGAEALIALRGVALRAPDPSRLAALPGGIVTRRRGQGQETADLREYVPGDDIRHVDRASTARTGRPHVRTFREERDRTTLLVADFRPSMLWGTRRALRSVAGAEALAILGWRLVEGGGRVGLLAVGAGPPVVIPARGHARGMLAVIGGLVRAHDAALQMALGGARRDPPLDEALARVTRLAPRGAEVIVASGFDAPGDELGDRLGRLSARQGLRLLMIADGATQALPPGTYPVQLPDGTRRRVRIASAAAAAPRDETLEGHPLFRLDAAGTPGQMAAALSLFDPGPEGAEWRTRR